MFARLMRRRSFTAAGFLLLAMAFWNLPATYRGAGSTEAQERGRTTGIASDRIFEAGSLVPAEESELRSSLTTQITSITAREGQLVSKGDLLMTLDGSRFQRQLNELQIGMAEIEGDRIQVTEQLEFLDAQLELADRLAKARAEALDARRQAVGEQLKAEDVPPSVSKLELAELELSALEIRFENRRMLHELSQQKTEALTAQKQLNVRIQQIKTEMESTRQIIADCSIKAPTNGVFLMPQPSTRRTSGSATMQSGAEVREGQPLGRIATIDRLKMSVAVNESRIKRVRRGQAVRITLDAFPGQSVAGRVVSVARVPRPTTFLDSNRVDYEVTVELSENRPDFKPGMTGVTEFLLK